MTPTQATSAVTITLPLPDARLGKNRRPKDHHAYQRIWKQHVKDAKLVIQAALGYERPELRRPIVMSVEWWQRPPSSRWPDPDAVTARLAACRDAAQIAGLVADDFYIQPGMVLFQPAVDKGDECVVVTFRIPEREAD